jgi:hypothetical protein
VKCASFLLLLALVIVYELRLFYPLWEKYEQFPPGSNLLIIFFLLNYWKTGGGASNEFCQTRLLWYYGDMCLRHQKNFLFYFPIVKVCSNLSNKFIKSQLSRY